MHSRFTPEIFSVVLYTGLCLALGLFLLGLVRLLTRFVLKTERHGREKDEPYECGVPLLGSARIRSRVPFYLIALLFVLFDIETVFLLPYAVSFHQLGVEGFFEVLAFVAVLGLGLLYLIRRGALDWEG